MIRLNDEVNIGDLNITALNASQALFLSVDTLIESAPTSVKPSFIR
jgi:hypothetical protein